MSHSKSSDIQSRIEDYEEAIATFARLHEELTDLRTNVTLPEAAGRLDTMLKLSAETLAAIKQSLTLAHASLRHLPQLELAGAAR